MINDDDEEEDDEDNKDEDKIPLAATMHSASFFSKPS